MLAIATSPVNAFGGPRAVSRPAMLLAALLSDHRETVMDIALSCGDASSVLSEAAFLTRLQACRGTRELLLALESSRQADFDADRLHVHDGWVLTQTEVQACILAARVLDRNL